ncbi:MAG TPA: RluA family pseudouridine synthase [Bacilli bacterium]|nr:RluA family pseudouridine synthase [Bacilli bacterium]
MNNSPNEQLIILYEDNHLIVVVKPENVLSQEDITAEADMLNIIKAYLKEKYQKPGNVYLGLIHRLDRRVGGVMVFAKSSKGASRLSEDIRNHLFFKEYYAIVAGKLLTNKTLTDYIVKEEKNKQYKAKVSSANDAEAKEAVLNYVVEKNIKIDNKDFTVLKIELITGRYNQIRLQLANLGHPIINDFKYGYVGENIDNNLGLWCYKIKFLHPVSKQEIEISYLPKEGVWRFL